MWQPLGDTAQAGHGLRWREREKGNCERMMEMSRDRQGDTGVVHGRERGRIFCLGRLRTYCLRWKLWAEEGSVKDTRLLAMTQWLSSGGR